MKIRYLKNIIKTMGEESMKLKYFSIFLFLFLLICSANAIYAATDDTILELDQSENAISADSDDVVAVSNEDTLSDSQDEVVLADTADSGASSTEATVSPTAARNKFSNDLKNKEAVINLTGDITITKPYEIRYDVVIDGQGHSIDAQKKSNIFKIYSATVTLKNIILKNGKSDRGGAIYTSKTKLTLKNCTFSYNRATESGGAIFAYLGSGVTIDKSTFNNNVATSFGGALYIYTAKLTLKNSVFKNNKIDSSKKAGCGGAVYTYKKSSSISNCTFTSNTCLSKSLKSHKKATQYQFGGGAVFYSQGTSHTLTDCKFSYNKASNHGGAVYCLKSSKLTINKCTFKKNKVAFEDGGAITFNGKKLIIKNSKFIKNHAYEDGGVMDACTQNGKKVTIKITGTLLEGNTAYKGAGALWMGKKTYYTMTNDKFIKNEAGIGGALFSEDTTAKITKCLFQGNRARQVSSFRMTTKAGGVLKHCGGALMLQKKSVTFKKCTFKKNRATYGGAIFKKGGKLKTTSCKFSGNKASKSGNNIKK